MKYNKDLFALTTALLIGVGPTLHAATLQELGVAGVCKAEDLETSPLTLRQTYVEPKWKDVLRDKNASEILRVQEMRALLKNANAVRDSLSSSHIVNQLAESLRNLRKEEIKLIGEGKLLPIEEGKTYSSAELKQRKTTMAEFDKTYVLPLLQESYRFYKGVLKTRDQSKSVQVDPANVKNFLEVVEKQRELLNSQLASLAPGIVEKLGTIQSGSLSDLPFSYRDGSIVKIRLQKQIDGKIQRVTLYPRMLLNFILGENHYFMKGLQKWKAYTEDRAKAAKSDNLAKRVFEQAEADLIVAKEIDAVMSLLTDRELFSLLDMFRQLQGDVLPRCDAVITTLNSRVTTLLKGEKTSSSKKFTEEEKEAIDQLAKEVVFHRDMFDVFSHASALALAIKNSR